MGSTMYFSANQSRTVSLVNQEAVGDVRYTLDIALLRSGHSNSDNFWISDERMTLLSRYVKQPNIFLNLIALMLHEEADVSFRDDFEDMVAYVDRYRIDVQTGDSQEIVYHKGVIPSILQTLHEGEDSFFALEILPTLDEAN